MTRSTNRIDRLVKSAQSSVEPTTAARIMTPPIVGVPALARCEVGPSPRIDSLKLLLRRRSITQGPRKRLKISAVTAAYAERKVM